MDLIGVQRVRGRDVATGIVLGAATGLAALFLYLDTTTQAITGATQQILFGSIFTVDSLDGARRRGLRSAGARADRLHLPAAAPELAQPRGGGRPRRAGPAGRLAVHGRARRRRRPLRRWPSAPSSRRRCSSARPPARCRLTRRFGWAIGVAAVLGVATTWLGIVLAYDSYYWGASQTGSAGELLHRGPGRARLPGQRSPGVAGPVGPGRNVGDRCSPDSWPTPGWPAPSWPSSPAWSGSSSSCGAPPSPRTPSPTAPSPAPPLPTGSGSTRSSGSGSSRCWPPSASVRSAPAAVVTSPPRWRSS